MFSFAARLAFCLLAFLISLAGPCQGREDIALAKLLRPRPRLLAREADIERIRSLVASDATARGWRDYLRARADEMLAAQPLEYELIGPRLLDVSRLALTRIVTLGLIYRLDRDQRYGDRAVRELMTICAFPDWHPSHFLDTAEMTHAAAIGYDWLHGLLTPEQRAAVMKAIVEKGLEPGLVLYRKGTDWVAGAGNWTQVCNSGLAIGALAVAEEEPSLAFAILEHARKSIPKAFDEYKPDGAWSEGPTYWAYATQYTVSFLAGLDTALGADFGLSKHAGLAAAGDFRVYSAGPLNLVFNYADAGPGLGRASQMFWLSRRYRKPHYAWFEQQVPGPPDPWSLIWYEPSGGAPHSLPLDKAFRRVDVAFFRSAWDDPNAIFVGFKGGDNRAHHGHLDLGTFVLDALGHRWALDLGGDDYRLPGYFDYAERRWTYYGLGTQGHNTLALNGQNQRLEARAPLIAFLSTPRRAFAVADLSAAYPMAKRVWRGVALLDRKDVLVQDEIETGAPVDLVWAMHTPAQISLEGALASLTQGGKSFAARILSPPGAEFAVASADPGPPQSRNEGVSKLVVRLPHAQGFVRLAVLLSPEADARVLAVQPLRRWLAGRSPR
jgi:hypothetical protein